MNVDGPVKRNSTPLNAHQVDSVVSRLMNKIIAQTHLQVLEMCFKTGKWILRGNYM